MSTTTPNLGLIKAGITDEVQETMLVDQHTNWNKLDTEIQANKDKLETINTITLSQSEWDALLVYVEGATYNIYADSEVLPNLLGANKMLNPTYSGTTSYEGSNGTISTTSNVLTLTGSGAGNQVRLRQYDVDNSASSGNTIFSSFLIRELDGLTPDIWLVLRVNGSDITIKTISDITQNVWTPLYTKYDLLASDVERVQVYVVYADASEATGAQVEFEGLEINEGMGLFYNLTEFDGDNGTDYATLTDEEVYAIRYQDGE